MKKNIFFESFFTKPSPKNRDAVILALFFKKSELANLSNPRSALTVAPLTTLSPSPARRKTQRQVITPSAPDTTTAICPAFS